MIYCPWEYPEKVLIQEIKEPKCKISLRYHSFLLFCWSLIYLFIWRICLIRFIPLFDITTFVILLMVVARCPMILLHKWSRPFSPFGRNFSTVQSTLNALFFLTGMLLGSPSRKFCPTCRDVTLVTLICTVQTLSRCTNLVSLLSWYHVLLLSLDSSFKVSVLFLMSNIRLT